MINNMKAKAKECRGLFYEIVEKAHKHGIELIADWVPRDVNTTADAYTKWSKYAAKESIPLPRMTEAQKERFMRSKEISSKYYKAHYAPREAPGRARKP